MAPATAWHCAIRPVPIILDDYIFLIQWSDSLEVTWLVLLAAWRLNLCPEIIGTVQRETLAGALDLPQADCLRIGVIDSIPDGTLVDSTLIVFFATCCVNHLPHISA
jgi:hypothetical protein